MISETNPQVFRPYECMIAARFRPGAISDSSSSHLPPREASKAAKPVMFPPGRLSRGTMPVATGSLAPAKTIGIVGVSRWTAAVAGLPYVTMMSGCRPTNSSYPIDVIAAPTKVHPHVAAIGPTQARERLREGGEARLHQGIVFVAHHEHADAPYAPILLRVRRERPCRRAAESSDEFAPPDFEHRLPPGQTYRNWGALSPSVLGSKDTTRRGRQIGCCTAESRSPPPTGLWQRWVMS